MTREQFIQLYSVNNIIQIMYIYYNEKCIKTNQNPIHYNLFCQLFPFYPNADLAIEKVISYYKQHFSILLVEHKEKIVKII